MTQPTLVLVCEDEVLIRDIVHDGLHDAGFEVIAAATGAEVIACFEANSTTIQALVTDIRLGAGPTGWDVARRARELVYDMPVVYMTADSGVDWSSQGVPNSTLIVKPFAVGQIVTAVATLINDAAAHRVHTNFR
jgi:DNA-binding response OmpR family regulator